MTPHPIIDQRVAGTGVEGEELTRPADPGDIGDAADVEDRERFRQRRSESGMEQRGERRPLAAGGDIGGAEIGDHVEPEKARQQRAVAQLPAAALGRAMQDRVAVEPDDIDGGSGVASEKLLDPPGMEAGQLVFDRRDRTGAAKDRPQPFAERLRVGERQRRPGDHPFLAIRLDHRDVDPVERGAAHQPEGTPNSRLRCPRVFWPGPRAYVG